MESTSADWSAALTGLVVLIVGIFPVLIWARYRWVKLKVELFPDEVEKDSSVKTTPGGALPARAGCALRLLTHARSLLDKEDSPEAKVAANALRKLETSSAQTAPAIEELIDQALETADVRSLLLGSGGLYVYVVVVPNRHEHSHLLRRYAPFSAGWRYHLEIARASVMASGQFFGLAAILLFLSPEGKENILQVSCVSPNSMLIPSTLVEGDDFKTMGVKTHDASLEFTLAA